MPIGDYKFEINRQEIVLLFHKIVIFVIDHKYLINKSTIMAHHQLDELDEKILKLIIGNARMSFLEVARECNVSGAAIHQRIQKLYNLGVQRLRVYC